MRCICALFFFDFDAYIECPLMVIQCVHFKEYHAVGAHGQTQSITGS